jgi:endonuclease/exonuclease/phosphatase (EEP) superfamily protein YafD
MSLANALALMSALGGSGAAALAAAAGLAGWRSGWLDVVNCFAPLVLVAALASALVDLAVLGPGPLQAAALAMALFASLYGLALTAPEFFARRAMSAGGEGAPLRIFSLNVWYDNASPKRAAADIIARDADVVLLQEAAGTMRAVIDLLRAHYPFVSESQGLGLGLVILAKRPLLAQGCVRGARRLGGLNLVWAEMAAPDGASLRVATTHFAWPFPPRRQDAQRRALAAALEPLAGPDLVLSGDFNTTPWSFAMRRQDAALLPLRRVTRAVFTWPARLRVHAFDWPAPILPIDHLYIGSDWLVARIRRVRITGSDHFAVEAELLRG